MNFRSTDELLEPPCTQGGARLCSQPTILQKHLMRNVNLIGREGGTERDESEFQKCHESVHTVKFAAEN